MHAGEERIVDVSVGDRHRVGVGKDSEPARFLGGLRAQARKTFAANLPADVTAADITAGVKAAFLQPFYQKPGTLTPTAFVSFFMDWEARGRPTTVPPSGRRDRGYTAEELLAQAEAGRAAERATREHAVNEVQPDGTVIDAEPGDGGADLELFPLWVDSVDYDPVPRPTRPLVTKLIPDHVGPIPEDISSYVERMREARNEIRRKRAEQEQERELKRRSHRN